MPAFLIRRDPRDISRIWVLEPEGPDSVDNYSQKLPETLERNGLPVLRENGADRLGVCPDQRVLALIDPATLLPSTTV